MEDLFPSQPVENLHNEVAFTPPGPSADKKDFTRIKECPEMGLDEGVGIWDSLEGSLYPE
jgi:hypothetical protein